MFCISFVILLCSGCLSHHVVSSSCMSFWKCLMFVLLDGSPYDRSTSDICVGSLSIIARWSFSPSSLVFLSRWPTIPKSRSPIFPFFSSSMFPGCRSAWNVPFLNICSKNASTTSFAIFCLSAFFVSESFVPSRYSIVSTFSVVYVQYTSGMTIFFGVVLLISSMCLASIVKFSSFFEYCSNSSTISGMFMLLCVYFCSFCAM